MIKINRDCGNCRYFIKIKNPHSIYGLCEKLDLRTNTDYDSKCKHFKSIKYKRNKLNGKTEE